LKIKINKKARISSWLCLILHLPQASRWRRDTKNYGSLRSIGLLCCLWGISMGNFQKQTFIECDRPDKRRVSYESRRPWHKHTRHNLFFFKCRVKLKHPVSANYETEKHQYFSIVSLPTDSVIVDHAVVVFT
jgi:hypothetical protein